MKKRLYVAGLALLAVMMLTACGKKLMINGEKATVAEEKGSATLYDYKDYQMLMQNTAAETSMVQFFNADGNNIFNCYVSGEDTKEKLSKAVEMYEGENESSGE